MACVAALLLVAVFAGPASAQSTREIVRRATEYAARYESQLPALVADERYEQRGILTALGVDDRRMRVLTSEFGWVRLPRLGETVGVREVRRIDGRPTDSGARLRELLERPPPDPDAEIRAILAESARYNLGPDGRNFNFPTFALVYLRPGRAERLRWRSSRRDRWIELRFTEPDRGTVVRSATGQPVQARGRFLVDPATGRLERAEIALREVARPSGARTLLTCDLTVVFRDNSALGLWLPDTMAERYEREHASERLVLEGQATYRNFRRYEASGRLVR